MAVAATVSTRQERVRAYIEADDKVSPAQRVAVMHPGNFFLTACPGSGKTRTLGVRVAWASVDESNRIVAATSYTNTAVREMQNAASAAGVPIESPHFVGTLHNLILRYVFYPFGHLAMKCEPPPRLVFGTHNRPGDKNVFADFGSDGKPKYSPMSLWDFHLRANGSVYINSGDIPPGVPFDPEEIAARCGEYVVRLKRELGAQGTASPSDAMFYAMEVLETQETPRLALAVRFDEIMVDEVQDTSDVQLQCLRALAETDKLKSLVLAGDLEQAIYEFAGARPDDVERLVDDRHLERIPLEENYRSSQALCDVAFRFSSRDQPDKAVGEHRDLGIRPEIILYDKVEPTRAIDVFRRRLELVEVAPERARVLCRGGSLHDKLADKSPTRLSRAVLVLGRAASVRRSGEMLSRADIDDLERLLATLIWSEPPHPMPLEDRLALRDAVIRLLDELPDPEQDLDAWITGAREAVKRALGVFGALTIKPGNKIRTPPGGTGGKTGTQAFGRQAAQSLPAHTVHSVKGETHDAVMLVAGRTAQHDHATQWLETSATSDSPEEIRIAYVALTRAGRYCAVALPADTARETVNEFVNRGFVVVTDPDTAPQVSS